MSEDANPHGEARVIKNTAEMVTRDTILNGLKALGLQPGDIVLVHTSLSRFGWVCGGAQTMIMALQDAITDSGTLIMPAHTSQLSEPSYWSSPPVPSEWWEDIRTHLPAFDRARTPTWKLGQVAECFRTFPNVVRSGHPQVSFAAWGAESQAITDDHQLSLGLGEGSPLARIFERNGRVLLLGVTHASNTSLHLAEHRSDWPAKTIYRQGAPVYTQRGREWVTFEELAPDTTDFDDMGNAFDALGHTRTRIIGAAECRLMPQRALVDFGSQWISAHRR